MSNQVLFFNDAAYGKHQATLTARDGHVLLPEVPISDREWLANLVREFRNTWTKGGCSVKEVCEWLESEGFKLIENNPPHIWYALPGNPDDPAAAAPEDSGGVVIEEVAWDQLTKKELLAKVEELGLEVDSKANKPTIIEAIVEALDPGAEDPE